MMPLLEGKTKDKAERNQLAKDAAKFYAGWYPRLWRPIARKLPSADLSPANRDHLAYLDAVSRRLARQLVHTMARHRQKLEHEQLVLARFVDAGVDIFAMAATLSLAARRSADAGDQSAQQLADLFCRLARLRVEANLAAVGDHTGEAMDKVAREVMAGHYDWLYEGVVPLEP